MLQLGGYLDCGAVYQHRRVGGCGQRLHPDDLFDLPDFGHVYGGRGAVLHQLWRERPASAGGVHRLRLCAHCGADGGAHRGVLRPAALHFAVDAHAGGRVPHDGFLRPGDFGGTALHFPLQLFCLPPAGGGKLPGTAGVFGGEHGAEHRPGCAAGGGHPLWRGGSCGGHCNRSRRGRRGHRLFYLTCSEYTAQWQWRPHPGHRAGSQRPPLPGCEGRRCPWPRRTRRPGAWTGRCRCPRWP